MRRLASLIAVTIFAAACSDAGVSPTGPSTTTPTIRPSHTTGIGDDWSTADDPCMGLSPCDAFDYRLSIANYNPPGCELLPGPGCERVDLGAAGFCFLPPTVDNHLSDPACSGDFVPGLDGEFQLAWCQVEYSNPDGTTAPTIAPKRNKQGDVINPPTPNCQDEADWAPLVEGTGSYAASVQFKKNIASSGDIFRLYIVRNGIHFAHRDVIVDPNLTAPADAFLHSIGNGSEPIKLLITDGAGCVTFDTQASGTDNAASCLIAGATNTPTVSGGNLSVSFNFPDGNPTFFADLEISECSQLEVRDFAGDGNPTGVPLVDVPLADCKLSLTSEQLNQLDVPGVLNITIGDLRWDNGGVFKDARLNVLQYDDANGGAVGVLPPAGPPDAVPPPWLGEATNNNIVGNLIRRGLRKLAALFGARPLYAPPSAGYSFTRLSDFQVGLMPKLGFDPSDPPGACATPAPHCGNLGTFDGSSPVPVIVEVTAPGNSAPGASSFPVPYTRLHFFPQTGTVACPSGTLGPLDPLGGGCYPAGTDDESHLGCWPGTDCPTWNHLVFVTETDITGTAGLGTVDWNLAGGSNKLDVVACGVARPGPNEPDPEDGEPGADGAWGTLGDCSTRSVSATGFDNGPADGFTPYEPVDTQNEVAIYGLPLTFEAETCPQITVDGVEGTDEWIQGCAEITGFNAPLSGKKTSEDNAWLYTQNDGTYLYVALKVNTNGLNDMFISFVENFDVISGDGSPEDGDDLLLLRLKNAATATGDFEDWHLTQSCIDSQGKTLCGEPDASQSDGMGAAADNGSFVFYEFKQPLNGDDPNHDLSLSGEDMVGLQLQLTGGKGGGKGGFTYPEVFRTYHDFTIE